ncbi:MAG: flagellar basal body rod protein FlgB [Firmicutes bacterium]|nr:flagellar basal body rod protein FlgB [Bacillota bacterium]
MDIFTSPVLLTLKKSLDAGALRQRVIANNIANFNTPGFKKSVVSFEDQLKNALGDQNFQLAATHPKHFGGVPSLYGLAPEITIDRSTSMRTDGNNVDADQEMTSLVVNVIKYRSAADRLSEKMSLLSYVITGGRR